jgi:hypothetical protein
VQLDGCRNRFIAIDCHVDVCGKFDLMTMGQSGWWRAGTSRMPM